MAAPGFKRHIDIISQQQQQRNCRIGQRQPEKGDFPSGIKTGRRQSQNGQQQTVNPMGIDQRLFGLAGAHTPTGQDKCGCQYRFVQRLTPAVNRQNQQQYLPPEARRIVPEPFQLNFRLIGVQLKHVGKITDSQQRSGSSQNKANNRQNHLNLRCSEKIL